MIERTKFIRRRPRYRASTNYIEKRSRVSESKLDQAIIRSVLEGNNYFTLIIDGVIQRLAESIDPIFIDRRMLALYQYGILDYDRVNRRWTVAPIGHSFAGYRTEPKKETAVEA